MKTLQLFMLMLVAYTTATAQEEDKFHRLYIEVQGGYGFSGVTDELGSPRPQVGMINRLMRADSSLSLKPIQGTLGAGYRTGLNVGYFFHRNIGVEFQFNYIYSPSILLGQTSSPTYSAEHTIFTTRVEFIPQLVFNVPIKRWAIYAKTGINLPLWGYVKSSISIEDKEGRVIQDLIGVPIIGGTTTVKAEARTDPKFSYGFQSRLGASFEVTKRISVFAEFNFSAITIRADKTTNNKVSVEVVSDATGLSVLSLDQNEMDVIDLESVYVNELTETSNNPEVNPNADVNKPMEELDFKDNFNSLGFSVGVRFNLW